MHELGGAILQQTGMGGGIEVPRVPEVLAVLRCGAEGAGVLAVLFESVVFGSLFKCHGG